MLQFFFFPFQILVQIFFTSLFILLESRTNYGIKFNFIGIKKTEGVSNFFFLKGRQIKNFKLLYIIFFLRSGWSWDHLGINVASSLHD